MIELTQFETMALTGIIGIAIAGLLYAFFLIFKVLKADTGTEKMREISEAIRSSAEAYFKRQFKAIVPIMVVLAIALFIVGLRGLRDFYVTLGRNLAFPLEASEGVC